VIEQARRSTAFILSYTRVVSPLLSLRYCAHTGKSFLAACFARVSLVRPSWYPGPQDLQATTSQLQRRPMPCAVWGCKVRSFQSPWPDRHGTRRCRSSRVLQGTQIRGVGKQLPAANRSVPTYPSAVYLQYSSINIHDSQFLQ
jgi:hypothetical protein